MQDVETLENSNILFSLVAAFDSGIGGLSIVRAIRKLIPSQNILYLADQAHVPYGEKELDEVLTFAVGIAEFLIMRGAALIVVACNTASSAALHHLRKIFPDIPIVGMEPAVKPATAITKSGVVGVLATPATFQGELYNSLVERFGKSVTILQEPCQGLVQEIELGNLQNKRIRQILTHAIKPMIAKGADVFVLGCTHYPFVMPLIREIAGEEATIINPAPAVAKRVKFLLQKNKLLAKRKANGILTAVTTGNPDKLQTAIFDLLHIRTTVEGIKWQASKLVHAK
ncbi:MAG TPA: glutamate racemase [Anaerolineae bacterium]|nr:glutamate racemase [Anaerolineae bacterium]